MVSWFRPLKRRVSSLSNVPGNFRHRQDSFDTGRHVLQELIDGDTERYCLRSFKVDKPTLLNSVVVPPTNASPAASGDNLIGASDVTSTAVGIRSRCEL